MKLVFWITNGLWWVTSKLPFWALFLLSDFLYILVAKIVRYRHKVVHKNLIESFPEKDADEIRRIEKRFYRWFCDYLVETIKLKTISPDDMRRHMVFKGLDALKPEFEAGRSVCLYMGHYCNWEWISSISLWLPETVQVAEIYHPLENKVNDRLFVDVRERFNTVCIPMNDTLRQIVRISETKPMIIGFISDQKPHWHNIHHWTDFLNHDTPVLNGTERIARRRNQVVAYLDVTCVKRGYYEAEIRVITTDPKSLPENEITDIYFRELEKTIRRQPEYWLWSHDRWKRTRQEFNERFVEINGKIYEKKLIRKHQAEDGSSSSASYTAG